MAIAVANVNQLEQLSGGVKMITAAVTLDTAYPTGGSAGLAGLLGLQSVNAIDVIVSTGFIVDYIVATDKLQVFNSGGGGAGTKATEVANATNLSAAVVQILAFGKSA
jgi:hypothetical protein